MANEPDGPKYPHIRVKLSGKDGNAFAIIGRVSEALKNAKVSALEVKAFQMDAMAADYDNVIRTCALWVVIS